MKLTLNKTNFILNFIYILFLYFCYVYFYTSNNLFPKFTSIFNYVNFHDHEIYRITMRNIEDGNVLLSINNDFGISFIYIYIIKLFTFIGLSDIILVSFIFNLLILTLIYVNYIRICDLLNLKSISKFYFFFGLQFLYFSQLINKDLLTILFFVLVLKNLIFKNYKQILFLSFLFFFVRIQLLIFGFITIFISRGNFKKRVLLTYLTTSIIAAIISVKAGLISSSSLGNGFSSFLIQINKSYYYLGYLIFNPLRIIQFLVDIYMSFNIYTEGLIDVAKILRIPLLILLMLHFKSIFNFFINLKSVNDSKVMSLNVIVVAFTLTWLMNPTINARYVMLIVPFLILLGRYVKINRKLIF